MIYKTTSEKKRKALFLCRCGITFESPIGDVKEGKTRSCGCLKSNALSKRNQTHGMSNHPLYLTWKSIKSRCLNPNNKSYKNYGGRGITMYSGWINNFKAFCDHASNLPDYRKHGLTLDRRKNNKGYFPGNLRWATKQEQSLNTRPRKTNTDYTGVSHIPARYSSRINVNKKQISLGNFPTLKEAVEARNDYILENNLTDYKVQNIPQKVKRKGASLVSA